VAGELALYDRNAASWDDDGDSPPHTDFVSIAELRGLLLGFRDVRIERRASIVCRSGQARSRG
jgi:hypothetical protein